PRPDLRADVVHDRNTQTMECAAWEEIEIRKIDDDQRIGARAPGGGDQASIGRVVAGNLRERSGQTGDGEIAIVVDEDAAGRGKFRTAPALHRQPGIHGAQFAHERTGVQISGRLTAREQKAYAQELGRLNSAGSSGLSEIEISVMRRVTIGCPFLRTSDANAIFTPDTARSSENNAA